MEKDKSFLASELHADQILGQDHAIETLQAALKCGRTHHAWIFSGPKGVGKFTTACGFARLLLDPEAAPDLTGVIRSDPGSRTNHFIDDGMHPDLHIVRKELARHSANPQLQNKKLANIPIDVLREHVIGGKTGDDKYQDAPAYRTASLGHGKVFIIDEAELIDRIGQSALLKTLEEPPPETFIFLITDRPERLLPTIRSRCQHVRFRRLDEDSMRAWWTRAEISIEEQERAWIDAFAEGSPGLATLAREYGFYDWQRTLDPLILRLERGEFPVEMGAALAELVEEFAVAWVGNDKNASKDAANKDGARHVLSLLAAHVRQGLHDQVESELQSTELLETIDLIQDAERQLTSNVNLKQVLENLVVQWAHVVEQPARAS